MPERNRHTIRPSTQKQKGGHHLGIHLIALLGELYVDVWSKVFWLSVASVASPGGNAYGLQKRDTSLDTDSSTLNAPYFNQTFLQRTFRARSLCCSIDDLLRLAGCSTLCGSQTRKERTTMKMDNEKRARNEER